MDFYQLKERQLDGKKTGVVEVYPDFKIVRSKDLMIRGKGFYAIWDETKGLWSTDEYDVQRLVDRTIADYQVTSQPVMEVHRKFLGNFSTNSWLQFRNYVGHLSDNSHQLDEDLTFANTDVKKEDYVSRRLPYPLAAGDHSAWDELMGTLYAPDELQKLVWAIGAIMAGDSKQIQKFIVLYGAAGTGKSTFLMVLQWLTEGYWVTFDAKQLTGNNNTFATEVFKTNPLVAIQHDGDLSKIVDNTKLNSIVSHEIMTVNEKYKPSYDMSFNAFLFMGTNTAVKITDAKSGILRRLIDVKPTGEKVSPKKYQALMSQIQFELGAIAAHCLETYREMGKDYYSGYRPEDMMLQTDVFFNFVESYWDDFKEAEGISLTHAYDLYKDFCKESTIEYQMPKFKFREELKNYFNVYEDVHMDSKGTRIRGWYREFTADKFKSRKHAEEDTHVFSLVMDETQSLLDGVLAEMPAQYSPKDEKTPMKFWTNKPRPGKNGKEYIPPASKVVQTKLSELDTSKEHYVKVPETHIVIDFDLTGPDGKKSAERNLEQASGWPSTYAEFSKSGAGIHLHYIYDGDVSELSRVYDDGIEVKVFTGDSSLRRKLSRCNNIPVATMSPGRLPLKEKKVLSSDQIKSEKSLRDLIDRNLRKEIHPGTKSSVDFIKKILDDAYESDLAYDVTDMRNKILAFANGSTNQPLAAIKQVMSMKFASEVTEEKYEDNADEAAEVPIVFYDVEVFPNLFMICWKYRGVPGVTRMINPTADEVEELLKFRLVGFNNRRYDNHILYGKTLRYDNERLYKLSQKLISGVPNAMFGEAYNLSYTDIYDFANIKQSLKKWEVELGIPHKELNLPWDEPVDPSLWEEVGDYCANDVEATEATFEARYEDFLARQILSELSGLSTNATTQQHTARIVFGDNRRPQEDHVYTDLSEQFPGYTFERGKSSYRGEDPSEGGYVYEEVGMYSNVIVLDVASMHPTSIEQLNLFGPHTKNFSDLKKARIAIKRRDWDAFSTVLDGKLTKFIDEATFNSKEADAQLTALSYALKIVINIVYGLTSAKFDNAFRDPRNIDNIVAKRGALFMIDLKYFVQELGFQVIHIKTDSIKVVIPEGQDPKFIIDAIMDFGVSYGYEFEHEGTYDKICLIDKAQFVAKTKPGREPAHWTATGAQFQHPYVFKKLFSHEPIVFKDKCETKSVTTSLWLDFTDDKEAMALQNETKRFVGKTGVFCPMLPGTEGGILQREKDGKFHAATGSTGYYWLEAERVQTFKLEDHIDLGYFDKLVDESVADISKHGDFEWFIS